MNRTRSVISQVPLFMFSRNGHINWAIWHAQIFLNEI